MVSYISELCHVCLSREVGGGGNSANERGEDARRLALRGVNFWILVSLRVFWARSHRS